MTLVDRLALQFIDFTAKVILAINTQINRLTGTVWPMRECNKALIFAPFEPDCEQPGIIESYRIHGIMIANSSSALPLN